MTLSFENSFDILAFNKAFVSAEKKNEYFEKVVRSDALCSVRPVYSHCSTELQKALSCKGQGRFLSGQWSLRLSEQGEKVPMVMMII